MRSKTPTVKIFSNSSYSLSYSVLSKGPEITVWTTWIVMLLAAFVCIFLYGRNIPLAEDWLMVKPLTGNEQNFGSWLWQQNNEHRIPLPKLIYLFFLKITNGDFRSGMVLNVLSLGFLSAVLIKTFKYIRGGKTNYTDAFFPIVFLHIGNWPNLFWSWQFTFVLPTLLTCFLILMIALYTKLLSLRLAIIASVSMISLPLCGANGLIYLSPVLPWLAYEGFLHLREKEPGANRRIGLLLFTAIGLTLLIVGAYFIGYIKPYWNPPSPGLEATLKTGVKFMAMSFGPSVSNSWRFSSAIILLLVMATTILLVSAVFKFKWNSREFQRAMGLLFFMGASMIFALAMGYGRAALVPQVGLPIRYVILAVPILVICYCSWELYGLPILRKIVKWSLFLSMLVLLFANTREGLTWRDYYVQGADAVIRDIKRGVPQSELVKRHQEFLLHWNKEMLITSMQQLKNAGMGPFTYMKDDALQNNSPAANNNKSFK
jgi:hypothetical protein